MHKVLAADAFGGWKSRFARSGLLGRMSTQVSQFVSFPKSKEGWPMPLRKSPSMGPAGSAGVAQGWGKVVARRVEEEVGPELDLDADQIEQFAKGAACAMAREAIEELLEKKAALLGAEQSCPTCQRLCPLVRTPRIIQFCVADLPYSQPTTPSPPRPRALFPS